MLVPMADAAAQLWTVLTLWLALRASRSGQPVALGALTGICFGMAYLVRHPQLPLAAGVVAAAWLLWRDKGRRPAAAFLVAFGLSAAAGALPDGVADSSAISREERSKNLSYHERLIYGLAKRKQPVLTSDQRRTYQEHSRRTAVQPIARRTFSKYLRSLCHAGLIAIDRTSVAGKGRLVQTHLAQAGTRDSAAPAAASRHGTEGRRGLLAAEEKGCA
jgi:hypothetical protein